MYTNNMSLGMAKPTKRHVHPSKTQISMYSHSVWSESIAWCSMGSQGLKGFFMHSARFWSDCGNVQADLSLCQVNLILLCSSSKFEMSKTKYRHFLLRVWDLLPWSTTYREVACSDVMKCRMTPSFSLLHTRDKSCFALHCVQNYASKIAFFFTQNDGYYRAEITQETLSFASHLNCMPVGRASDSVSCPE